MALSADAVARFYRAGKSFDPTNVADAAADLIWDVSVDADGNYLFSNNGDRLSVNDSNNSLPLNDINDAWVVTPAATEDCYYIINAARETLYVEWYEQYSEFSTYGYNASNEGIYAMQFIPVTGDTPDPGPDEPDTITIAEALAAENGIEGLTV